MDIQNQIELEKLYAKNQTMGRLRMEFQIPEIVNHCKESNLPLDFALDLLSHMVLHKRATMSMLVGILHSHFGDRQEDLQACADMIWKAAELDLIDYDPQAWKFVIRIDLTQDVYDDLERYQYPLPMVVKPMPVLSNRDTGYVTIRGSVILKGNHHDDDVCLDHLNRVNKTALKINPDTARMIKNQWRNLDKPKEGETRDEYDARVRAFDKYDRTSREVMESMFLTGTPIYLTHRYDKRGRCYAQGYHVNTQGSPWNKAVIEFAQEELVQ
jgi:hypothetical protein